MAAQRREPSLRSTLEKPRLIAGPILQSGYPRGKQVSSFGSVSESALRPARKAAAEKSNGQAQFCKLLASFSSYAANRVRVSKTNPLSPSMTPFPILNVQRLTKTYATGAGKLTVLKDISFVLPQGATCSILGPSGSGKTTLLGLCAGLDRPTSGSVLLNGITLGEAGEDERARIRNEHVGFVFQNFQLIPTLTALENIIVPMELRGDRSARALGLDLLRRVGLAERVDHYPAQLSGGEQQRVALARAFINRPKILFADEPTGNLDSETSQSVIEILLELNTKLKTALVLVTHDPDVARLTERTIRLRNGVMI